MNNLFDSAFTAAPVASKVKEMLLLSQRLGNHNRCKKKHIAAIIIINLLSRERFDIR